MFGKERLDEEVCLIIKENMYYVPECSRLVAELKGISIQDAEKIVNEIIKAMRKKFGTRVVSTALKNDNTKEAIPSKTVACPKCGGQSITTTNKKISVTKGVVGGAIGSMINPVGTVVGAAVGATHSKKIYNVCMNCGHKWKL